MTEPSCSTRRRDPTPAEIAERAAEIRAGWSPDELLKRLRSDWRPDYQLADGRRQVMNLDIYAQHHELRETGT